MNPVRPLFITVNKRIPMNQSYQTETLLINVNSIIAVRQSDDYPECAEIVFFGGSKITTMESQAWVCLQVMGADQPVQSHEDWVRRPSEGEAF